MTSTRKITAYNVPKKQAPEILTTYYPASFLLIRQKSLIEREREKKKGVGIFAFAFIVAEYDLKVKKSLFGNTVNLSKTHLAF